MAGREEQLLAVRIRGTLERASKAERTYIRIVESSRSEDLNDPNNDELHDADELLAHHIRTAFRECQMLAERLHMPDLSKDIRQRLRSYGTGLTDTRFNALIAEHYCEALADIWDTYDSMAAMALAGVVTGLSVLETILRNTAKIVEQAKLEPKNETEVRNAVLNVLQLAFVDARKDVSIAKNFKTYKPDIGIPSLLAAVEYKFLRSKKNMSSHLDQVFADMKGYGGHPEWRNFYAVLYQKGPFFTPEDVIRAFHDVGASANWTPIVLNGPAT